MPEYRVLCGDSAEVLKSIESDSVQLIMTSPPYANARAHTYGGVPHEQYVDWFLPISAELFRVLKPTGTFILNIKENVVGGERHIYILELILALREQGWLWTEEFIWYKKNAMPGKWNNRFRDAWERLLQFNKQKQFDMYQESVMTPIGAWAMTDKRTNDPNYQAREEKGTGSGFGMTRNHWRDRDMVYPDNVLNLSVVGRNKGHSAVFPKTLPTWFIKLFSDNGDTVLDPFVGSGTTMYAALELGRATIGIDQEVGYIRMIEEKLHDRQLSLPLIA